MFSLVPQLICATLEKVLHKVRGYGHSASPALLQKVQGKQLALQLQELPWRFVLSATADSLLLNQHNEKVDCVIATDLTTLQKLNDPSQFTRLIKQEQVCRLKVTCRSPSDSVPCYNTSIRTGSSSSRTG